MVQPGSVTRDDTEMSDRASRRSTTSAGTSLSATTATSTASGASGTVVVVDVAEEAVGPGSEPASLDPPVQDVVATARAAAHTRAGHTAPRREGGRQDRMAGDA